MTARDFMENNYPEAVDPEALGGVRGCPFGYGIPLPAKCVGEFDHGLSGETCRKCWGQELPSETN